MWRASDATRRRWGNRARMRGVDDYWLLTAERDGYSDGLCRTCAPYIPSTSHHLSSPERVLHPFREPLHFIVMSVTVLICIGISDLSVSGGGHRCHRCHHFMGGTQPILGTHARPGWCVCGASQRGCRRFVVTAVIAPRYVTRQTIVGKDQLISRRLI